MNDNLRKYEQKDFGYPRTCQLSSGELFTVYYTTDTLHVTYIKSIKWSPTFKGPLMYARGSNAVPIIDSTAIPQNITNEIYPLAFSSHIQQSFFSLDTTIIGVKIRISSKNNTKGLIHTKGLYVLLRKMDKRSWFEKPIAKSITLYPQQIKNNSWNYFPFEELLHIEKYSTYNIDLRNADYTMGEHPVLLKNYSGNHDWYINTGSIEGKDYPNGCISKNKTVDMGFIIMNGN